MNPITGRPVMQSQPIRNGAAELDETDNKDYRKSNDETIESHAERHLLWDLL